MNNIIFGTYNGFNSIKTEKGGIYYFLTSLRKYNKDCKVVILCEKQHVFDELTQFAKDMNFEIYCDFVIKYNLMYYRFEIYRNYLKTANLAFDKILLSDINDVVFQNDPFTIQFAEELYCALETSILSDKTNSSSNLNMNWIHDINHLANDISKYVDNHIVCAGTILGSYDGIISYLDFYEKSQKLKIVNDQALLNVYVYNYLSSKQCLKYEKSKILTLDKLSFETLTIIDNAIVNDDGEKYCIIHQINRCNLPFMLNLANNLETNT